MRRLIVCLLGAFVAGLALSAPHSEAQSEHPACAPFRLQWNAVKAGSDLGSMDRIIARIPGVCPALAEQARRERATAASRLADAAKAPLPKATKAPSVDTETVFFQGARSCADWRSYLGQWPSGRYAALARNRLAEAPCVTPPVIAPAPARVAVPAPATPADRSIRARSAFGSDIDYETYMKATLRPGDRVRAIRTFEKVPAGSTGTFYDDTSGNPPAFVMWDNLQPNGCFYANRNGAPATSDQRGYCLYFKDLEFLSLARSSYAAIGTDYRTLTLQPGDWNKADDTLLCENTLTAIPSGWHIASAARTQAISPHIMFDTHILVSASGEGYWSNNPKVERSKVGTLFMSGRLVQEGASVRSSSCSDVVLLERDGVSNLPIRNVAGALIYTPGQGDPSYAVIGVDYRTLTLQPGDWNKADDTLLCENTLAPIPAGWHIASAPRTQAVARHAMFDTHIFTSASGDGYWSNNPKVERAKVGTLFLTGRLVQEGGSARSSSCSDIILLERDGKSGLPIKNAAGEVIYRP